MPHRMQYVKQLVSHVRTLKQNSNNKAFVSAQLVKTYEGKTGTCYVVARAHSTKTKCRAGSRWASPCI